MQKTIGTLLLAALPCTIWAQKNVKISGLITDGKVDSFAVVNLTQSSIAQPELSYVKPDAQGNFTFSIPMEGVYNSIAIVYNNQHATFLTTPKEKLSLSVALKDKVVISFPKAKANSTAVQNQNFEMINGGFAMTAQEVRKLFDVEPSYFKTAYDSLKNIELSAIPSDADANLKDYWKKNIEYYFLSTQLMYGVAKIQNMGQNASAEAAQPYVDISMTTPQSFHDDHIYYPAYQDYVVNYSLYQYVYKNLAQANDATNNITQATKFLNSLSQKKSAALGIAKLLQMAQKGMDPSVWNFLAKDLVQKYPKDPNAAFIQKSLDEMEKFNPGKKAIDFEFVTLEGEKKKLSDYKGKVVYLDFWASWCGPCRQQMPFAKEVKKHFAGKDVVFLYVSIDDTDEKWHNGIKSMQVEGVQTRSGGWGGELPRKYGISSIPAYFLIDKQGNFAASPPRPSQKQELIQVIEQLLAK